MVQQHVRRLVCWAASCPSEAAPKRPCMHARVKTARAVLMIDPQCSTHTVVTVGDGRTHSGTASEPWAPSLRKERRKPAHSSARSSSSLSHSGAYCRNSSWCSFLT